jgi:integrase
MGSVRKRPRGGYQIRYRWHGAYIEESVAKALGKPARHVTAKDAGDLLKARLREITAGRFTGAARDAITVTEALDDYVNDLRLRGRTKGWRGTRAAMRGIAAALGEVRITELTPAGLRQWAESLLAQRYAPATVRQRCAILKSALKLAHREQQLAVIPAFPSIRVDNARQVFFTRPEFEAVHGALAKRDPDAADACLFAYLTGWRKGEVLALQWAWIDRAQGLVRLPDSKNDDGRVLPMVGALREVIEKRWKARALGVTAVFHRKGKPIRRMDRGWTSACVAAGLPGRWFHDFRRSAARDLVEAGNDYAAAMAVTGHKSVQVFRRYRIVDVRSTARALTLMQDHRASMVTDAVNQA